MAMSPRRISTRHAGEDALVDELDEVYREADALYAGYRCEGTTECCRFAITGREPYVTSIEMLAIERAVAARGGPLAARRRALPLWRDRDERSCPLLTEGARCAVYAWRPLGCRSYWCQRADAPIPVAHADRNQLVRRVQAIAARHRPGGDRGRPLTRVLAK
jgi:hypothetical protein